MKATIRDYPLKILVLSDLYPNRMNEHRGIFVHHQVKSLMKRGMDIRVISPVPYVPPLFSSISQKWKGYASLPREGYWDGVKVYYPRYINPPRGWGFAYSGHSFYWAVKPLVQKLRESGFQFDIIHSHVALPDGACGLRLARELGCPHVVTIHGQDLATTISRNSRCRDGVIKVIKGSHRTIVVSRKLLHMAEELMGSGECIEVVHNGYCPETGNGEDVPVNMPPGFPKLVSVGHLIPIKGHDDTIKAVASLEKDFKDISLTIIGDGQEESKLKQLAIQLGIEQRVFFGGRRSPEEVRQYMRNADLFVLPSWREGFGIVYLEAMAEGKVVVACQGQGIEDVIISGENGILVPARDSSTLANELHRVLKDENMREKIGKNAYKLVTSQYTWPHKAEEIAQIYEGIREVYEQNEQSL